MNWRGQYGFTPLMQSASAGQTSCMKVLIDAGVDVNVENEIRLNPLIVAAGGGKVECVQLLIQSGADVNKKTFIVNATAVMRAASRGHFQCLQLLIQAGADVNCVQHDGFSALFLAAKEYKNSAGHLKCIKILLQAKAFIDTAEILPPFKKPTATYRILLAAGAGVRCRKIPDGDMDGSLKNLCRDALRRHLLKVEEPISLHHKVALLEVPCTLQDYLLYDVDLK